MTASRTPFLSFERYEIRQRINAALRLRNWTQRHLATLIGLKLRTVRNIVSGTNTSAPARAKIEDVLGQPFWSTGGKPNPTTDLSAEINMKQPNAQTP